MSDSRLPQPLLQHLRTIEANTAHALSEARQTTLVGPFLCAFHPSDPQIFLNYALPLSEKSHQPITPELIGRLRSAFRRRGRTLRFEYFELLWPDLRIVLERAGCVLQGAMPLMLCWPGDLRRVYSPGVLLRDLTSGDDDATFALHARLGQQSFDQPDAPIPPETIAENRGHLRANRYRFTIAYHEGNPAGVGALCVGNDELAGIGTLPPFRRRGIAGAVSAHLVLQHFERGGAFSWLSAGSEAAEKLYQKVGFRTAGSQLNYMDPPTRH